MIKRIIIDNNVSHKKEGSNLGIASFKRVMFSVSNLFIEKVKKTISFCKQNNAVQL